MVYLELFWSFLKIGLFSFGGGYAMIPLIQKEIEANNWICPSEFIDIIAIAEMTPGPIAVNTATFVGYRTVGVFGSVAATIGIALPSFIIIILLSGLFFQVRRTFLNIMIFAGIRPVITGLIVAAAIFVGRTALFKSEVELEGWACIWQRADQVWDPGSVLFMIVALLLLLKFKLHPILMIILAGAAGVLFYGVMG